MTRLIVSLVLLMASILVLIDACMLQAKRGGLGGGFLDMGPVGWFFAVLLFWVVTLPCYLFTRPKLVRRRAALAGRSVYLPMAYAYASQGASPGWYPDPSGQPTHRWWDGRQWTSKTSR